MTASHLAFFLASLFLSSSTCHSFVIQRQPTSIPQRRTATEQQRKSQEVRLSHKSLHRHFNSLSDEAAAAAAPTGTDKRATGVSKTKGSFPTSNAKASSGFQSSQVTTSSTDHVASALSVLLVDWIPRSEASVGFLFLSKAWSDQLPLVVQLATARLGVQTQLITIVGGGVVGTTEGESEGSDTCSMSFFGGTLPAGSQVELFSLTSENDNDGDEQSLRLEDAIVSKAGRTPTDNEKGNDHTGAASASHIVFGDPHFTQIHKFLEGLDGMVAGGISVARPDESSLAIGNKVMPPGSLIGARFTGNLGLQIIVSHGCRPIGPTYRVTSVDGPAIYELDGVKAMDRLQETMQQEGPENQALVRDQGVLAGIHREEEPQYRWYEDEAAAAVEEPEEFTLREVTGFRPRSGTIVVCGPQIKEGDHFRFHVRSNETALEDWQFVLKRTETERLFLGDNVGTLLGALQISCMARGEGLFGKPNVDLQHTQKLVDDDSIPIAGLLANAEIGPVGIRMGSTSSEAHPKSFLHGFASVVAMLCDYTKVNARRDDAILSTCLANSTSVNAWE